MPELELFQTDLSDSPWFWFATIATIGNVGVLLLIAVRHHFESQHWLYLAAMVLVLAGGLARSLFTYRSVRALGINWYELEPDGTLAFSLATVARDIEFIPYACNYMAIVGTLLLP